VVAEIAAMAGWAPWDVWERLTWTDYTALTRRWAQWPPLVVSTAVLAKVAPFQRDGSAAAAVKPPEISPEAREREHARLLDIALKD
jgi:hypothetical protein